MKIKELTILEELDIVVTDDELDRFIEKYRGVPVAERVFKFACREKRIRILKELTKRLMNEPVE